MDYQLVEIIKIIGCCASSTIALLLAMLGLIKWLIKRSESKERIERKHNRLHEKIDRLKLKKKPEDVIANKVIEKLKGEYEFTKDE